MSRTGTRHEGDLAGFFEQSHAWIHVAWVKRGFAFEFYKNGEPFARREAPVTVFGNPRSAYSIGRVGPHFFGGEIADVRIYRGIRTDEMIRRDLARSPTDAEPELVASWPLDEGHGTMATDRSKNGRHGLIHAPSWGESDRPPPHRP